MKLSNSEFHEEHESKREECDPPRQVPEELHERYTSEVQTEEEPLTKCTRDIGKRCPFVEKVPSECEEPKREECRNEQCQGEKKHSLTCDSEGHRIDSKNENAEDAEGRERKETKDDN